MREIEVVLEHVQDSGKLNVKIMRKTEIVLEHVQDKENSGKLNVKVKGKEVTFLEVIGILETAKAKLIEKESGGIEYVFSDVLEHVQDKENSGKLNVKVKGKEVTFLEVIGILETAKAKLIEKQSGGTGITDLSVFR